MRLPWCGPAFYMVDPPPCRSGLYVAEILSQHPISVAGCHATQYHFRSFFGLKAGRYGVRLSIQYNNVRYVAVPS